MHVLAPRALVLEPERGPRKVRFPNGLMEQELFTEEVLRGAMNQIHNTSWTITNETNQAEARMKAIHDRKVQYSSKKEVDQQVNPALLKCAGKKDGAQGTVSPRGKSAFSVESPEHRVVRLESMDDSMEIPPAFAGKMNLAQQTKEITRSHKTRGK